MSITGGDIAQTYALLQKMYELMNQIETQGKRTEVQVTKNIESLKQLESAVTRYLLLVRRMGLPENVDTLITKISMLILAFRQLEQTVRLTQAALAGAGPIGWIVLGASAAYTALSFYSLGNQ